MIVYADDECLAAWVEVGRCGKVTFVGKRVVRVFARGASTVLSPYLWGRTLGFRLSSLPPRRPTRIEWTNSTTGSYYMVLS